MTDLTNIKNRHVFDELPEGIEEEREKERWKIFREKYHLAKELVYFEDFPLQLDIGLSSSCNFKCPACPQAYGTEPNRILPFQLFKKALDEGQEHGLCSVKLNHNNEPLLLKDFPKYIRYAKNRGVLNTYIATNGSMLNSDLSLKLIDAGLTKIMISLDAVSSDTYFKMRKSTRYEEVVSNIERFIELRNSLGRRDPSVRVNFLRTALNVKEESAFIEKWKDKVEMIGFQDMLAMPDMNSGELFRDKPFEDFKCSFPFKHITINVDGNLLPCCTFSGEKIVLGNIRNMTIKEAWNGEIIQELRRLHAEGRYKENSICSRCVGA